MEQPTHSPKFQRHRKFLLVLPVLVLPFVTLMFWALGGGNAADVRTQPQTGFNTNLPGAYLKEDKPLDKLSYYKKANSDSVRLEKLMKDDPYYNPGVTLGKDDHAETGLRERGHGYEPIEVGRINTSHSGATYNDPNEAKVYEKLEKLNKVLNQPVAMQEQMAKDNFAYAPQSNAGLNGADIGRLEQMMQAMGQPKDEDPELQQLNGMLEKILDIQHPDRVQEKLRQLSEKRRGQVYGVFLNGSNDPISLIDRGTISGVEYGNNVHFANQSNRFYSFDDSNPVKDVPSAIKAVIHETQTLTSGSTVKFRLVHDVYINGVLIPKGNFLYGIASLNGERLNIKITSIRYESSLFPVELSVHDLDGLNGIYIPGAITRDVAKQSADRSIQGFGLTTFNPSLEVQAASAGIETAKSLLSKKIKLVKVTVKAGYQVLLRDEKQQSNS